MVNFDLFCVLFYFFSALILLITVRCIYLICTLPNRSVSSSKKTSYKLFIVVGSGGHTTEILRMVRYLNPEKFSPRIYIVADSDETSGIKIIETEKCFSDSGEYRIYKIPRSRKVHQSFISSFFSTLYSVLYSIPMVFFQNPDVILCNGPGTCVPICLVSFLARAVGYSNNTIIFVESICRVKTLSLTGKILIYFADKIIVQWPELRKYKRAIYVGDLK